MKVPLPNPSDKHRFNVRWFIPSPRSLMWVQQHQVGQVLPGADQEEGFHGDNVGQDQGHSEQGYADQPLYVRY